MSCRTILRPQVPDDLDEIVSYLEQTSIAVADRFIKAALAAIEDLANMPGKGSLKPFRHHALKGIRSWAVPGFPNHLIFYYGTNEMVVILAIIHGAWDIPTLLKDRLP